MTRSHVVAAIAILGPWLWMFGPAVFGNESFVFRDAAHYYLPLFEWTCAEWSAGRIPLWNPHENCGTPALADTTSSVFYPGKLFFCLTFLSYTNRFVCYVSLHVLLAAAGAWKLARRFRASTLASGLAAVTYAYSGSLLFQYCNVVFLIGAAWLPFGLLAADRMLTQRHWTWSLVLGLVLALMVLGGDPQAAYHTGLLATLLAVIQWRKDRSRSASDRDAAPRKWFQHRFTLLASAALAGLLLAAIQILPAIEWSRRSDRVASDVARCIYEIPLAVHGDSDMEKASRWKLAQDGILGEPRAGTHHDHAYQFSVSPWRLPELVWPNFGGQLFPVHRRWTAVLPGEDRVWSPSLYLGLLPLLLALSRFRLRRAAARDVWLSWSVLLFGLGSLGWYGLGAMLHALRVGMLGAEPDDVLLGNPVGGVYWLMTTFLPGYVYFRFPAKLFVVAALGLSLLAARGWDWFFSGRVIFVQRAAFAVAIPSFVGAFTFFLLRNSWWAKWLASARADDIFGPLDVSGAASDVLFALLHACAAAIVIVWVSRQVGRSHPHRSSALAIATLLLTALELTVAQQWMVRTAPADAWRQPSPIVKRIRQDVADSGLDQSYRVYRGSPQRWVPPEWRAATSTDRQLKGLAWDRDTLLPKYHLSHKASLVEAYGTMASSDFLTLMQVAKGSGPRRPDSIAEPHRSVLRALSARYLVLPADFSYPRAERLSGDALEEEHVADLPEVADAVVWRNPQCFPRAWIVHDVSRLPALTTNRPSAVRQRVRDVYFPKRVVRDLSVTAVVETEGADADMPPISIPPPNDLARESCRIVVDEPQRVEIEVELATPGLVVLNDTHYPGWQATVSQGGGKRQPVSILRTNRIMRGVALPSGKHRLVYKYRPTSFRLGAALSAISWCLLVAVGLLAWRRLRRTKRLGRVKL